ncbi:dymeclin-like isoform X2 [Phalacrocorax carbo]|uniref:dymeclin-like isoform X2 n=1 Tax=Phalacrocorax carbo TaxID=9209 RepID=UPI0031196E09
MSLEFINADLKLLEEDTTSVCKSLVEKNPRTGNLGLLVKVFLSRTKELKISAECQNHLFILQAHNALFIICRLLKVFISQMSEEELQLHFTYEEKALGSYGTECEDLIEELLCCLIQLIVEIPLLSPCSAGCTRSWEGTQPGQLTPADQRDIPYHMTSCSVNKAGEEEGRGGCSE